MSAWTPDTEEVRRHWAVGLSEDIVSYFDYAEAFDAWLNTVRAAAWDEGHADGQTNEHEHRPGRKITNPYRATKED